MLSIILNQKVGFHSKCALWPKVWFVVQKLGCFVVKEKQLTLEIVLTQIQFRQFLKTKDFLILKNMGVLSIIKGPKVARLSKLIREQNQSKTATVQCVQGLGTSKFLGPIKVICTKYSKHWPYTVAHTIDCVCRKC